MDKIRIRSKWMKPDAGIAENAGAVAYVCWQISLNAARNLHAEDFLYSNDTQRMGVIAEYLTFLLHCSDRLISSSLGQTQRAQFINHQAQQAARHLANNQREIAGPGDYEADFYTLCNQRSQEYAICEFTDQVPGFEMRRCFASHVQDLMGRQGSNRWISDQIMEIDSLDAVEMLCESSNKLFCSSTLVNPSAE